MVVGVVSLCGVGVVGVFLGNGVSRFPLGFEVNCTGIPVVNLGGDSIHSINSLHECYWDTSQEEIDKSVFMGNFTEGDMVFELRDIISEWEVL